MTTKQPPDQPNTSKSFRTVSDDKRITVVRLVRWSSSAAAVGVLGATFVFVIRVLIIGRFNPEVSSALLSYTSTSTVLHAIALQLIPALAYVFGVVSIYDGAYRFADEQRDKSMRRISGIGLIVAGFILTIPLCLILPVPAMLIIVFLAGVPFATIIYGSTRRDPRDFEPQYSLMLGTMVLATALQALFAGHWLPPESAKIHGESTVMYVLAGDESDLAIFSPADRAVLRVPAKEVEERQYCSTPSPFRPLAARLFGDPLVHGCPKPVRVSGQ